MAQPLTRSLSSCCLPRKQVLAAVSSRRRGRHHPSMLSLERLAMRVSTLIRKAISTSSRTQVAPPATRRRSIMAANQIPSSIAMSQTIPPGLGTAVGWRLCRSIDGRPLVFGGAAAVDADISSTALLKLHKLGTSYPIRWVTIHTANAGDTVGFDANAAAKTAGATP